MTTINDKQIGGDHYKAKGSIKVTDIIEYAKALGVDSIQHWDLAVLFNWDPYQYQITKYVMRYKDKNGLQDLEKGLHFHEKYVAIVKAGRLPPAWQGGAPSVAIIKDGTFTEAQIREIFKDRQGGSLSVIPTVDQVDFSEIAKPTMWVGFTFEACQADKDLFTCQRCHRHFDVPHGRYPGAFHKCEQPRASIHLFPSDSEPPGPAPAEPGAGYVNQG